MENLAVVTGASGFIGSHLVDALIKQGFRVRCLVRKTSKTEELLSRGAELVYGDVTDAESVTAALAGADQVFHLAGLTRELRRGDFMRVNRQGCVNVGSGCVHTAQKTGKAPILLVLSSLAAAGPGIRAKNKADGAVVSEQGKSFHLPYCPRTETMLPTPISPYGRSKLAGEQEVLKYADTFPITILRPPFIFGQGDALMLPLVRMAKKSWCFPIPGYFDQFYTFLHVSDLVEQIIGIAKSGQRAKPTSLDVINSPEYTASCSGEGIYFASRIDLMRMSKFINTLAIASGRKGIRTLHCPPAGVLGVGLVMETYRRLTRRQVPLDWNKAIEAIRGPWIAASKKIGDCLGTLPARSLEEQIQETFRWYDQRGLLD